MQNTSNRWRRTIELYDLAQELVDKHNKLSMIMSIKLRMIEFHFMLAKVTAQQHLMFSVSATELDFDARNHDRHKTLLCWFTEELQKTERMLGLS